MDRVTEVMHGLLNHLAGIQQTRSDVRLRWKHVLQTLNLLVSIFGTRPPHAYGHALSSFHLHVFAKRSATSTAIPLDLRGCSRRRKLKTPSQIASDHAACSLSSKNHRERRQDVRKNSSNLEFVLMLLRSHTALAYPMTSMLASFQHDRCASFEL